MKRTLKIASAIAALLMTAAMLASCGEEKITNIADYVTVPEYKGIEISQEKINEYIEAAELSVLDSGKELASVDRAAEDGDTVVIDYVGTLDGEEFDGGKAEGYSLELGSGSFIPGFEDGLIGTSAGDEVTLDLTFPDPYQNNTELSGKDVQFAVTVNEVQAEQTPELSDELVASYYTGKENEYTTIEEMKEGLKAEYVENEAWTKLFTATEFIKLPESRVKAYYDNSCSVYKSMALSNGYAFDSFITMFGYSDADAFYAAMLSTSKNQVKHELIAEAIAKAENITLSDEEYEAALAENAAEAGIEVSEYRKSVNEEFLKRDVLLEKITGYVAENAVIAD